MLQQIVDRDACVQAFGAWTLDMLKHRWDLARYDMILSAAMPQVVVELGRYNGNSARWFARYPGVQRVVSVDIEPFKARVGTSATRLTLAGGVPAHTQSLVQGNPNATMWWLDGNSTDPLMVEAVRELAAGRHTMVVCDSDHSRDHVLQEIRSYAPMVTVNQFLVVEDGVLAWLPEHIQAAHTIKGRYNGTVLEAIQDAYDAGLLEHFSRAEPLETFNGKPTMHPCGWWRRV